MEMSASPSTAAEAFAPGSSAPDIANAAGDVNRAFNASKPGVMADMAKRGMAGSGAETLALAGMGTARSTALGDAYAKARGQQQARQGQLLQMGGAMAPTPTTAAPLTSTSRGSSQNAGPIMGLFQ